MLATNNLDLSEILIYLVTWITLYMILCQYNKDRGAEWHCREVTVVHAVTVSLMAFYCILWIGPSPFTNAGGPNSPSQTRTVSVSLAYFLFDMGWCLYHRTEGPVMLAHHFLSILGLTWCLVGGYYGTEIVATIGGAEMTNPLLQLRWFLRQMGYKKSTLADIVDWVFIMSFGFIRIGVGSRLLYSYYQQDTDIWGRFGGTSLYIISWIFFINIINYAFKKYFPRYKAFIMMHTSSSDKDPYSVSKKQF